MKPKRTLKGIAKDAIVTDQEIVRNLESVKSEQYAEVAQAIANMLAMHVTLLDFLNPLIKTMLLTSVTSCDYEISKLLCKLLGLGDNEKVVDAMLTDARMIADHRLAASGEMAKTIVRDILKGDQND